MSVALRPMSTAADIDVHRSNPTADNFASELWQFRLPRLGPCQCRGSVFRRRQCQWHRQSVSVTQTVSVSESHWKPSVPSWAWLLSNLVSMPGEVRSHQSALECVTVVNSTTHFIIKKLPNSRVRLCGWKRYPGPALVSQARKKKRLSRGWGAASFALPANCIMNCGQH